MSNEKVYDEAFDQAVASHNGVKFIRESNRIEGILREPTEEEIDEFDRFMALKEISIEDLEQFVSVYQPGAKIRYRAGMNVLVGNHKPPPGGPDILHTLSHLLARSNTEELNSFQTHLEYETLHPFTDCNGRSGRMLWAWQQRDLSLCFLHMFYYQALSNERK